VNQKRAFIEGMDSQEGAGSACPGPFDPAMKYTVAGGKRGQVNDFRAGKACANSIGPVETHDGARIHDFPVGAGAAIQVPLRVVEDRGAGNRIEVLSAAANNGETLVQLDIGLLEIAS
jgi:assimilatory nitrate reductase catalytic subunit